MELTDKQKQSALKQFEYKKNYYKQYKIDNKETIKQQQSDYFKAIYSDEDKHKRLKEQQRQYYKDVIKPRRIAKKAESDIIKE